MTQLEFTPALYQRHSPTSWAAAEAIRPDANKLQARVLAAIVAAPEGLTDEEGIEATGMNPSTYRPRRVELARAGRICHGMVRLTRSGRKAIVWVAKV